MSKCGNKFQWIFSCDVFFREWNRRPHGLETSLRTHQEICLWVLSYFNELSWFIEQLSVKIFIYSSFFTINDVIDLARNGNSGCANEILRCAKCHFWRKSPWKWKNWGNLRVCNQFYGPCKTQVHGWLANTMDDVIFLFLKTFRHNGSAFFGEMCRSASLVVNTNLEAQKLRLGQHRPFMSIKSFEQTQQVGQVTR